MFSFRCLAEVMRNSTPETACFQIVFGNSHEFSCAKSLRNVYCRENRITERVWTVDKELIIRTGAETLQTEIEGLEYLKNNLDDAFVELVRMSITILDKGGKIVVCGIGKSGHVGKKIAATLASTGSPSIFVHAVEAMHGDLGMISEGDLVLALSYSGESDELVRVILPAKRLGVTVASFTGNLQSSLAKLSDLTVSMCIPREACPFNLAPTTSSTATLALGDALAMTLLRLRRFTKEKYGRLHPSGAIGRAVTMRVSDVMRSGDRLARVRPETTIKETILAMTHAHGGSAVVTDNAGMLLGIFTDGDFRRKADGDMAILSRKVGEVMTPKPASIRSDALAIEVLKLVEKRKIDDIVVVDDAGRAVGIVDIQDLPGLKLM
ncbi:MAG: Arabinose 5-phosphate isomerase KdsD [Lentisphaerae bacterium ADurb.Bin242]|nr:MAG: Arabinose 5-phosphate isomerase KdsD [Lentisphaerae bacterium ADurb.Bin242]